MFDMYLTVRSVTRGQRGRDALNRAGIRNRLLRAPRAIASGGCGYALAMSQTDWARATAVLELAGVNVEGSWLRARDGEFTPVEP